ncbi:hypothetical protein [uncultured Draconibacterium sp.]|uniref:hypothetical protein n=1 Tax=uncultured Draconibacterium sp. TaxID=1573823 RepID=UPI0029C7B752|nr:hypothetical protein [uncultured Draconibacterium sp.]
MIISEEDFKKWLTERGYDYETHKDDNALWNEYLTIPSKYSERDLELDVLDLSNPENFFKTQEEINEEIRQEHRTQDELYNEYISWKLENWRSFDLNAGEMDLYYQFMMQREKNRES